MRFQSGCEPSRVRLATPSNVFRRIGSLLRSTSLTSRPSSLHPRTLVGRHAQSTLLVPAPLSRIGTDGGAMPNPDSRATRHGARFCGMGATKSGVARSIPMLGWLPGYRRAWLRADVIAGLTVWALIVPESMAYAGVAGVPVQYGLYAVPLAVVAYAVFGTSRQLFVGPSSTVAALSAATVAPLVASSGANPVALTAALAFVVGVVYLALGAPSYGLGCAVLRQAGA